MPLYPPVASLALLAATPVAGYALVNGTGTILSWTAPNDGALHRVILLGGIHVTSTETGGAVTLNVTQPDGNAAAPTVFAAGQATGANGGAFFGRAVQAGSTVTVTQSSALTGGAATAWVELWGL